mgnify:CR=1 FL=1
MDVDSPLRARRKDPIDVEPLRERKKEQRSAVRRRAPDNVREGLHTDSSPMAWLACKSGNGELWEVRVRASLSWGEIRMANAPLVIAFSCLASQRGGPPASLTTRTGGIVPTVQQVVDKERVECIGKRGNELPTTNACTRQRGQVRTEHGEACNCALV